MVCRLGFAWLVALFTLCLAGASPARAQEAQEPQPGEEPPIEEAPLEEESGAACPGTGVVGVVRDRDSGETLIEAPVTVLGRRASALTDYEGRFALELRPGTYTLRATYDLYRPERLAGVVVTRGECTEVEILMGIDSTEAEELVIEIEAERGSAATQLRARRESAAVQDSISAEEIARTPDSTASDSARRIVGATVLNDYLYIRGMGGRYVSTLLNGVPIPSTDPDLPGVQLDIFPSTLMDAMTVRKTMTPELPAAFGGGLLNLETRSFPSRLIASGRFTMGFNTQTIGQSVLRYPNGGTDFLGFDDGTRTLPGPANGRYLSLPRLIEETGDRPSALNQLNAASLAFADTMGMGRDTGLPSFGLTLNLGDTLQLGGGMQLGLILNGVYGYNEQHTQRVRRRYPGAPGDPVYPRNLEVTERVGRFAIFGSTSLRIDRSNTIQLLALLSQSAEQAAAVTTGLDEAEGFDLWVTRHDFTQRTLATAQLAGEHRNMIGSLSTYWTLFATYLDRNQPDIRDNRFRVLPDGRLAWSQLGQSGERTWLDLGQNELGGNLAFDLPVDVVTARAGAFIRVAERTFDVRRFRWQGIGEDFVGPPEALFSDENINTYLRLEERTQANDAYFANTTLAASYASLQVELGPVRLFGGARFEAYRQIVETVWRFSQQADRPPEIGRTTRVDVLPAGSASVEIVDGLIARASYGGTVVRPELRELAPFSYYDYVRARTIQGQIDLRRTFIHNFDVRLEWFPGAEDVIAVSGFVKLFEDPVELVIKEAINLSSAYENSSFAETYGGELEVRLGLRRIHEVLSDLSVGANLTLTYSRVTTSQGFGGSQERPLFGQSPWVVNGSLRWAPDELNLDLTLLYNVFGPRLTDVGLQNQPNVFQQPFHQLDFIALWEPASQLQLRFAVTNILFQRFSLQQGDTEILGFDPGTTFQIGVRVQN